MYAGVQLGEYAVSIGKQSLWLGPGEMGALMVSDNADPMYSVRLSRTAPLVLPGFLKLLGQIRGEDHVCKTLWSSISGAAIFQSAEDQLPSHRKPGGWFHACLFVGGSGTSVYA